MWHRLPAVELKPSKDQRRTVNKWNDFVLGDDYKKAAAKLHPVSKEYVHTLMWPQRRADSSQRESTPQEWV